MENAVELESLGKMYRLFDNRIDRVFDLFGIDKLCFGKRKAKYREFWALRNVNLKVPKGERIGIIGRNGAGKSTMLKLITGNLRPTEGNVRVNGKIQALMQIGTGFHPDFTGIENIRTALAYAGLGTREINRSMEEIIEFSELEDYIHQPVKFYSAGMYSRLAFAVSTAVQPEILIIDEVLGAGDAAFVSKCAERMKRLTQDTGATVLFVSHSMDSVLEICNRAILVERGEITHEGTALEVSKIYNQKIRAEEELRAKAKEYRIGRKSLMSLVQADEATQILILRLVGDQPHPKYPHVIYGCSLKCGEEIVSELHIGAPADDDFAQFTRVISDKGTMDWSEAKKERGKCFRIYSDYQGKNQQASFQMAIPVYLAAKPLMISVEAEPDERENVYLEYFDGQAYIRLGVLKNGETTFAFSLQKTKQEIAEIEKEKHLLPAAHEETMTDGTIDLDELRKSNSIYGSDEGIVDIKNLDIIDASDRSARVFFTGASMRFRIQLNLHQPIESFVAVVCIMSTSGKTVTQAFCKSEDLGMRNPKGTVTIEACLSPLRIGAGDYMASIGVFKSCDMSRNAEEESYVVADRALFFKVEQPLLVRKALGDLLHPCKWRYNNESFLFDGTKLR